MEYKNPTLLHFSRSRSRSPYIFGNFQVPILILSFSHSHCYVYKIKKKKGPQIKTQISGPQRIKLLLSDPKIDTEFSPTHCGFCLVDLESGGNTGYFLNFVYDRVKSTRYLFCFNCN